MTTKSDFLCRNCGHDADIRIAGLCIVCAAEQLWALKSYSCSLCRMGPVRPGRWPYLVCDACVAEIATEHGIRTRSGN
jgi:hypothetical protein